MSKNKYIVLIVGIISLGLFLTGGTYAFLSFNATVTNANYSGTTSCFIIDYDEGEAITGTLFQSSTPKGGLYGTVKMNINESCNVGGRGTIKLNVGNATSSLLLSEGALKYAVYEYLDEEPVSSGTITSTGDINIYEGFVLPRKFAKTYYIYVWLDGSIADNDYVNLSFDGKINASAIQSEDCVITYIGNFNDIEDVWTQTITNGESFKLPSYSDKPFATYDLNEDYLNCVSNGGMVNLSCGAIIRGNVHVCDAEL